MLFDLDGTLIDSAPDLAAAADTMRASRGLPSLPLDRYRHLAGSGARGMLRAAFDLGPDHVDYEALKAEFLANYMACMTERTLPFAGVAELLSRLVDGGMRWGVVTNKARRFTEPLTQSIRLFETASTIVSGDSTPHAKPHPAPVQEAVRQIGLTAEQCLYVGDDERDIVAGRAAGVRTVAARYGYLGPSADVSSWGAHAVVTSPLQVLQLLDMP